MAAGPVILLDVYAICLILSRSRKPFVFPRLLPLARLAAAVPLWRDTDSPITSRVIRKAARTQRTAWLLGVVAAALLVLPPPVQAGRDAPDMSGWSVTLADYEAGADAVAARPHGDNTTSYFVAPDRLLGDWSDFQALRFEKSSSGGRYFVGGYDDVGDVVLGGPGGTASYRIEQDHSGEWRAYTVPLGGTGWTLGGGAVTLGDVLAEVTSLRIRAEYGVGRDRSGLRRVEVVSAPPPADAGAGPGLTLAKRRFAPEEPIYVTFTADEEWGRKAWVGILPADVPHGSEKVNDKHELDAEELDGRVEGRLKFFAPLAPGRYDLRMNQTWPERGERASVTFEVVAPPPSITIGKERFRPGEPMQVRFTAWKLFGSRSWIGILPADVPGGDVKRNASHDLDHEELDLRTSGEIDFEAPLEPGRYELRMNQLYPEKREVASAAFEVWEPPPSVGFTRRRFAPDEPLRARFVAWKVYYKSSWIGIVPADVPHGSEKVNDRHELQSRKLEGRTTGVVEFDRRPDPGRYELRMNRTGKRGGEVASAAFQVLEDGTAVVSADAVAPERPAGEATTTDDAGMPPEEPASLKVTVPGEVRPREEVVVHYRIRGDLDLPSSKLLVVPADIPLKESWGEAVKRKNLKRKPGTYTHKLHMPKHMGHYELRAAERGAHERVQTLAPVLVIDRSQVGAKWAAMADRDFEPAAFIEALAADTDGVPLPDIHALYLELVRPLEFRLEGAGARLPVRLAHGYGRGSAPVPLLLAAADPGAAFDRFTRRHERVRTSLGHDVNLKAKLEELAKSMVGYAGLGTKGEKLVNAMVNGYDLQKGIRKGDSVADDFAIFGFKTMVDSVSPAQARKLFQHMGVDPEDALGKSAAMAGHAAQGAGQASAALYTEALKTVVYGGLDVVCPGCGVARRGLEAAVETVKATRAFVEDSSTEMMYRQYVDNGVFLVGAGHTQVLKNARRVLEERYREAGRSDPPTNEEVEAYIQAKFDAWKRSEAKRAGESELFGKAREAYLALPGSQRRRFGSTPEERATRFGELYLEIRGELQNYQGTHRIAEQRLAGFATRLTAAYINEGNYGYRAELARVLRGLGWIEPLKELEEELYGRVRERMGQLSHHKLEALAGYLEINIPDDFYDCLCRQTDAFQSHVMISYHPGPHKCASDKGGPCVWSGLGCGRMPMPKTGKAWKHCVHARSIETSDGPVRFDRLIAERVQRARVRDGRQ